MQLANLAAHLHPELCVQVRQRLVEQEHLRIAHDCPSHGDALPLTTGQLAWASIKKLPDTENRGGATDTGVALGLLYLSQDERELHVFPDGHVWIERIILEHHRDVPILRIEVVDHPIADPDPAAGDLLKTSDHAQQRRFPAARGSHENDELAILGLNVHVANDFDRAEGFFDLLDTDASHSKVSKV